MASHKSAAKRARQSIKRTLRNKNIRTKTKGLVRSFREAITRGDKGNAGEHLIEASRMLRKAASKGVLHKRTASRYISRLMQSYNKAS